MIYIGIDPDLIKNGVATWHSDTKNLELELKTFYDLMQFLHAMPLTGLGFEVIIEAGWLNKPSNFRKTQNKSIGERIAKNVGENHAVGKLIEQACLELGITYKLVRPTKSKVNKTFFFKLTGIKTSNQELIDAGMLVYGK